MPRRYRARVSRRTFILERSIHEAPCAAGLAALEVCDGAAIRPQLCQGSAGYARWWPRVASGGLAGQGQCSVALVAAYGMPRRVLRPGSVSALLRRGNVADRTQHRFGA
jgi:hypothetical protein